jgi:DNA polymerase
MCAKYGRNLPIELCDTTIEVYREKNDMIASMWKAMSRAAIQAVLNPGMTYKVRGKITFGMSSTLPFPALMMRLPSGHHLIYPYPRLKDIWMYKKNKYSSEAEAVAALNRARAKAKKEKAEWDEKKNRVWKTTQITFFGPDPITHQWGRQSTYGGKLLENAVQATAGDFMAYGMIHAEKAGYEIFLTVHDQALSHYRPELGHTQEGFRSALCTLPAWAEDFPLDATCDITPFYTKD